MKRILNFFRNKKIDILLLIILFLLVGFIYRGWFSPGIIAKGDLRSWSDVALREFISPPSAWLIYEGGGYYSITNGIQIIRHPFLLFQGLVAKIFDAGFSLVERLTLFYPFFFLSICGMYWLSSYLFKNKIISFFTTLAYLLNPLTLIFAYVSHYSTMIVPYALFPFIFLFWLKSLDREDTKGVLKFSVLTGLFVSLALFCDIKMAYLIFASLIVFWVYDFILCLFSKKQTIKKEIILKLISLTAVLVIIVALNLFWIIPYFSSPPKTSLVQTEAFNIDKIDNGFSLFKALIFYLMEFNLSFIPLFITSAIIFSAFLFFRKSSQRYRKILLFFGFWFLFAVFLHKSGAEPFPEIFIWMYKYIPGFIAFRNPNKIAFVSVLPWSLLFGFSVFSLTKFATQKLHLKENGRSISQGIVFIFIILLLFTNLSWLTKNYPIADGGGNEKYLSTFEPEEISVENLQMERFFSEDSDKFRILYLPTDPAYGILNKKHTAIYTPDLDPGNSPFLRYSLSWRWYLLGPFVRDRIEMLGKLLSLRNIKYVVYLPPSDIYYKTIGAESEVEQSRRLLSILEKQKDLQRIDVGENIYVFLNKFFRSDQDIFLTKDSYLINGGLESFLPLSESSFDFNDVVLFSPEHQREKILENSLEIKNIVNFQKTQDDILVSSLPAQYFLDPWPYAKEITTTSYKEKEKTGFWREYENRPTLANTYGEIMMSANGLIKGRDGILEFPVSIEEPGRYEVWARMGAVHIYDLNMDVDIADVGSLLTFKINGNKEDSLDIQFQHSNNLGWVKLLTYDFYVQDNQFEMEYRGKDASLVVDQFLFIPQSEILEQKNKLEDFLKGKSILEINQRTNPLTGKKINEYMAIQGEFSIQPADSEKGNSKTTNNKGLSVKKEKVNESLYKINFSLDEPAYLVFRDNFDPYWELALNGKKYKSIKTMDENNSFYIESPGDYSGMLEFRPQKYMDIGFKISVIFFAAALLTLFFLIPGKKYV